jgi:spore coat protein H
MINAMHARAVRSRRVRLISELCTVLLLIIVFVDKPAQAPSSDADLFTAYPVLRLEIQMPPASMESLRSDSRRYVRATVRSPGNVFQDVGVHLKGSTGSFRSIDDKPGLTVDFERFVRGQKLRGVRKIHLNNSVEDATYLKEKLGSELFRAAHVPAPRVSHALVELNGRPLGLYVLQEGFTEDFLGRYFERADGNLYDTDQGHDVNLTMKRHLGRDSANGQMELQRLAAAAMEPDLNRRWERLQEVLDLDEFLAFMAMEIMICHWDGYCLGRNNFRVYQDPRTGKVVFLPSGMDQLFAQADLPWKPDMAGLVARALMEIPEGRQQYAAKFKSLCNTVLVSERLAHRVNQFLADLRPSLESDAYRTLRREAAGLCGAMAERELSLRKQLGESEPAVPRFAGNQASLAVWRIVNSSGEAKMLEGGGAAEKRALQIIAGVRTSASWGSRVRLCEGHYRFQGKARVTKVTPLPFGVHQGASLRVGGRLSHSSPLIGTTGWQTLEADFEVSQPEENILLICELRATTGQVWFDKESLVIVRQP